MNWHRPRLVAVVVCLAAGLVAVGQNQPKKAPATIKLLLPQDTTRLTLKVEGKELDANEKATKEGVRVLVTPELEPGKTYAYKIEAVIEPNNYTKIERTRDITFKSGEEVTVDLRKKDDKIKDNVIIRWVPTPKVVVKDMCELAKVGPNDVVMDPGCGDAIMIITAVQDMKAKRGLGTDLDAEKVKTSQENVEKAGLKDKITIKQGNALELGAEDLKDVTVMMLYMGNELNIRLRPILWEHLKPGARVVSHRFIMGDWKPDKSITVNREGDYGVEDFHLHVWTVTGKEKTGDYPKVDPATLDQ
jgi:uncharacterized protein (TIGR03000 family)